MAPKIADNSFCALAINSGVDILLIQNADSKQVNAVSVALGDIFKNIMPFLRDDKQAEEVIANSAKIIADVKKQLKLPSDIFIKNICKVTDWAENDAYIAAISPISRAYAELLEIEKENAQSTLGVDEEYTSPLQTAFDNTTNAICRGESAITVSKQLSFINEVLKIKSPEFIGDEKCQEIVEAILENADENYPFDRELTEEIIYRIFNKVRLGSIIEYCNNKPSKSNIELLESITNEYGAENTKIFIDDPFFAKKQNRLEFVKGLQKYTLEALILTKDFLESQGLRFYLTEGTLLGAIRHKGFIPWDDDVDIAMPREDYDRLVELARKGKIPPELNFDALENNPNHWVLGAKMQLVRKTPYIQHKVTRLSRCNGPYVDIFPVDYWDRPAGLKYSIANICVKLSRRMLFIKTGYSKGTKKKPLRILMRIFLPFVKNSWIEKFAIRNMKKFLGGNRKYLVNLCSYYPYYKEIFPTGFFGEPKYVEFEGVQMPVPCEYDYMLKTVYGKSYDTIPPVRVTNMRKHAFELNEEMKTD